MLGKLLAGRYQVVQLLSAGGFCQTYLAQDTYLPDNPTCVVKHLKSASNYPNSLQTLRWLFTGEAQALKKLGIHNQIPQLLAHFETEQEFYLVQEFITGHPLSVELQLGHRWSESQVIQLLREVLGILEFVHSQGLIHRDLKPSNLIRRQQDNRIVLIDFGSVKQAWTQVVNLQGQKINTFAIGLPATITIGTPGYMPVEQERGRPRPSSDIYALGMIGIQALTGLPPTQILLDADTCELAWQGHSPVSTDLAQILNKMVRYHFNERYQSATEVLSDLQPLTKLYPPAQPVSVDATTELQLALDTISSSCEARSELPLVDRTISSASFSTQRQRTLIAEIGIGVIAALALTFGIYSAIQSPAPASRIQKYPVSIPLKSNF